VRAKACVYTCSVLNRQSHRQAAKVLLASDTMRLKQIRENVERFGAVKAFQDVALRGLNVAVPARILKVVKVETVCPEFLQCDKLYQGGFLSHAVLTELVRDHPEYEISESFLREAFAKGDECYGFLDGPVLANYGWYSNKPTAIHPPELTLHFDDRYIYMYKGFTHVKYRGQRLHAIAMTRALEAYLAKGLKGLVSYVEWNNFGSLKSCYRMGYVDIGNLYLTRIFGNYSSHPDRGCRNHGIRLEYTGSTDLAGPVDGWKPVA
jgi:hypothetical protein